MNTEMEKTKILILDFVRNASSSGAPILDFDKFAVAAGIDVDQVQAIVTSLVDEGKIIKKRKRNQFIISQDEKNKKSLAEVIDAFGTSRDISFITSSLLSNDEESTKGFPKIEGEGKDNAASGRKTSFESDGKNSD